MAKKEKELSFEKGLERLREIVEMLETGAPTLSETINLFEEGVSVARHLEALLADAETKVEKLASHVPKPESKGTLPADEEVGEAGEEEALF